MAYGDISYDQDDMDVVTAERDRLRAVNKVLVEELEIAATRLNAFGDYDAVTNIRAAIAKVKEGES